MLLGITCLFPSDIDRGGDHTRCSCDQLSCCHALLPPFQKQISNCLPALLEDAAVKRGADLHGFDTRQFAQVISALSGRELERAIFGLHSGELGSGLVGGEHIRHQRLFDG